MCSVFSKKNSFPLLLIFCLLQTATISGQSNLLLNGGFEDINSCSEYNSECGVEGWFYLKDVKAQMLSNDSTHPAMGSNSFGLFFNWLGYTGFSPLIGTVLPCRLQKDKRYSFKGMVSAKLNPKLIFKTGVATGEKFYVPKRPFSSAMHPDSIIQIQRVPGTDFYQFEFSFIADGKEKYLTFGTYIEEDTLSGKKNLIGTQSVSVVLDNFQLLPSDMNEMVCNDFVKNKRLIYNYNSRHKEMDYSLYGKGEIAILINGPDSNTITHTQLPAPEEKTINADTLKLGDVFFDFNKATLKPAALKLLETFFRPNQPDQPIDSIYIEGHTDSIGTDARNLQLSRQRSESVQSWLLSNKVVSGELIHIHPFGKTKPIAANTTIQGRALNRRVELIVFRNPKK